MVVRWEREKVNINIRIVVFTELRITNEKDDKIVSMVCTADSSHDGCLWITSRIYESGDNI